MDHISHITGKRGSGKTTLALALAYFFENQGKQVATFEPDVVRMTGQEDRRVYSTAARSALEMIAISQFDCIIFVDQDIPIIFGQGVRFIHEHHCIVNLSVEVVNHNVGT